MTTRQSPQDGAAAKPSAKFQPPPLLAGRRAVVTGAARGIGKAVADAFAEAGATVVRLDIKASRDVHGCDVADEASVARAFEDAAAAGPIDDVIHVAAIAAIAALSDTSAAEFRRVIDVNLTGAFLVSREAARRLRRGGNLVLFASQYGLKGWPLWGRLLCLQGRCPAAGRQSRGRARTPGHTREHDLARHGRHGDGVGDHRRSRAAVGKRCRKHSRSLRSRDPDGPLRATGRDGPCRRHALLALLLLCERRQYRRRWRGAFAMSIGGRLRLHEGRAALRLPAQRG